MSINKAAIAVAGMLGMIGEGTTVLRDNRIHNGVVRETHPWDNVHLTKSERKGKTPDEIQAMRENKWKELGE